PHIAVRITSSALITIASLALLTMRFTDYRNLNDRLAEYITTARQIPMHTRVLAIDLTRDEKPARSTLPRIRAFWHALGYAAVERYFIDLGNYQAAIGYFPVRFRGDMNPG